VAHWQTRRRVALSGDFKENFTNFNQLVHKPKSVIRNRTRDARRTPKPTKHSAAAGGGSVDAKEYDKKGLVLQQCREKIESVCFDSRLRKVTTRVKFVYLQGSCGYHDTPRRENSRISTPASSTSGRGAAAGKKRSDSQRRAIPARLVNCACLYAAPPHARYEVKNQTQRRTDPNRRVK
jgi:hypothetical protein